MVSLPKNAVWSQLKLNSMEPSHLCGSGAMLTLRQPGNPPNPMIEDALALWPLYITGEV